MGEIKEMSFQSHTDWVQVPVPPLTIYMTSGRSFNISLPLGPHL